MEMYPNNVQAIVYSDLNYKMYQPLTPSDSEDNKSPIYTMLDSGNTGVLDSFLNLTCSNASPQYSDAYLEISEQPVEKFRFRYRSEMSGTHGSLQAATSEKNRKPSYPTVRLCNYEGPAILRCSLYTYSKELPESCRQPHPHRLVMKNDSEERVDPHDKRLDPKSNPSMTIIFKSMGIIHTARKHIQDELKIKLSKLKLEELLRTELAPRPLNKREEADIKRQIQEEEKSINLNVVCLRFDAFLEEANGVLKNICDPIYSNPIFNLKSAMTGDLRIVRMDHSSCPASGGKEIFLLVEKVAKKNIKVQFLEIDGNERISWSQDAKFHENDVHHQYAIVIKAPPYKDINIEQNTTDVFIQLFRPSDGETSEPRPFTYTPDRSQKRKRGRCDDFGSSSSMSMEMPLPAMIVDMQQPAFSSEEILKYVPDVNSEDFAQLLPEILQTFDSMPLDNNASTCIDGVARRTNSSKDIDLNQIRKQFYQISAYINSKQPDVEKMIRTKFNDTNEDGNNILHLCHIYYAVEMSIKLKAILLGIIKRFKLFDLLNVQNNYDENVYCISIRNGKKANLLKDLPLEHMQIDPRGYFYPLHSAVKYDYGIDEICTQFKHRGILEKCNADNIPALLYAVEWNKLEAVKKLIAHGAQINMVDNRSGNNALQMAILNEQMEIAEFLINSTLINKSHKNFQGKCCLEVAQDRATTEIGKKILKLLSPDSDIPMEMIDASLVKEEDESSSECDEDMDTFDIDIKKEETVVMETISDENVSFGLIRELSELDIDIPTINKLYDDLNFGFILNTNAFKNRNKIEFLINLALKHNVDMTEIRTVMEENGVSEGVRCINRWIKK